MENNEKQEPTKRLKVNSDWGKLELAGQDIYAYRGGKDPYNKLTEEKI